MFTGGFWGIEIYPHFENTVLDFSIIFPVESSRALPQNSRQNSKFHFDIFLHFRANETALRRHSSNDLQKIACALISRKGVQSARLENSSPLTNLSGRRGKRCVSSRSQRSVTHHLLGSHTVAVSRRSSREVKLDPGTLLLDRPAFQPANLELPKIHPIYLPGERCLSARALLSGGTYSARVPETKKIRPDSSIYTCRTSSARLNVIPLNQSEGADHRFVDVVTTF